MSMGISRSLLKSIKFNGGNIKVNDVDRHTNFMVKQKDIVEVRLPAEPSNPHVTFSKKSIEVIYEDNNFLVVNKPPYLATVQSSSNQVDTLVNRVKYYLYESNNESQIVHVVTRLDQDTSGLVLFAKHRFAHTVLDRQLKKHSIKKMYKAIVAGHFSKKHGVIDSFIKRDPNSFIKRMVGEGGKESVTEYWVRKEAKGYSLVEIQLHTGRTHQIRVHMASIGHALLGDPLYNQNDNGNILKRQALCCYSLQFYSPFDHKDIKCQIPISEDMINAWEQLKEE